MPELVDGGLELTHGWAERRWNVGERGAANLEEPMVERVVEERHAQTGAGDGVSVGPRDALDEAM